MKALLDFFALAADPFSDTPDTSFLYSSETHREAFATLLWGINANRGFVCLTAVPGMGKTTLLFKLMSEFRESATTAFVFQTQADPDSMLRLLVADLGLTPDGNPAQIHSELNRFLKHQAKLGKRVLLIVDEAQNLQEPVLEMLRLISDFETERRKLVQFVLSGQTQLLEKLSAQPLEQLRQRIAAVARIEPLDQTEVSRYIQHRLSVAGRRGVGLFSDEAVGLIAEASQGIPREINSVAFSALCIAYATRRQEIGVEVVREAIDDRNLPLISKLTKTKPSRTVRTGPPGERRSYGRRNADFSHVRSGKQQVGLIVNLGPGGAALWVSAPDSWGDSEIQFRLPGSEQSLEVKGTIVWKRESQGLVGMVFSDLPSSTRSQLEGWTGSDKSPAIGPATLPSLDTAYPRKIGSPVRVEEIKLDDSRRDGGSDGSTRALPVGPHAFADRLSILNPELKAHSKLLRKLMMSRTRRKS